MNKLRVRGSRTTQFTMKMSRKKQQADQIKLYSNHVEKKLKTKQKRFTSQKIIKFHQNCCGK